MIDLPEEEQSQAGGVGSGQAMEKPAGAVPSAEPSPTAAPHVAGGSDEEESVDDYMTRLLARHRGGGGAEASAPQRPLARPAPAQAATSSVARNAVQTSAAASAAAPTEKQEPLELSPRTVAPEKHSDFSAMRELANFSARGALRRHERRRLSTVTNAKLLVMVVALTVGGSLVWLRRMPTTNGTAYYSAAAAFLVALLWGAQYLVLTLRLLYGKLRGGDRTAERRQPSRPPAAPPRKAGQQQTEGPATLEP
jgi:hypothetical protein